MKTRVILATLVALATIVGGSVMAYRRGMVRQPAICQLCGRDIPRQTAFRVETRDGSLAACCPSCAMHYMRHHPGRIRQAFATDFDSGRPIPAQSASYDQGGDVQYCTAHQPSVERGPLGVNARVYDRCLPTLVAFDSRSEAEAYQKQHGGRLLTYDQAMESVKSQ